METGIDKKIRNLVDLRLAQMQSSGLMKHPAVPTEMVAGPGDDEGWIPWKAIPSMIIRDQIVTLENDIGYNLPKLFIDLLLYKHYIELNFENIRFLPLPSDEGIYAVRKWIYDMSNLFNILKIGLMIFASSSNDESYYCFSAKNPQGENHPNMLDFPIMIWDPTTNKKKEGKKVFNSFEELVENILYTMP